MTAPVKRGALLLGAITLVGLLLRLPAIGYSFYGDETFSVLRDSAKLITDTEDRFRPVFFSLLYLWRQLGFSSEIGLRLLPLLFGVAQIPVAFCVGRRLVSERLGLVFAALIAGSPMLIEFSVELRMYSLVALLALLQALTLLRVLERPTLWRWGAFVLVGLIGVYTHLHYWLFMAGFALTFLRERRVVPLWKGAAALGTVLLLYLPNLPNIAKFIAVRSGEYGVDLPSALPKLFAAVTLGFNYFALGDQAVNRAVGSADLAQNAFLIALAAVPALLLFYALLKLHVRQWRERPLRLCHELFTVPTLLALAATVATHQYWLQPKYIIFVAPFALLFIALAWESMTRRWLRVVTLTAGLIVLLFALLHYWNPEQYGRREDWRGLSTELRRDMTPASALLVVPGGYGMIGYYWPEGTKRYDVVTVKPLSEVTPGFIESLRERLRGKSDVYYVRFDTQQNLEDPADVLPQALNCLGARRTVTQYNPRLRLYHWDLPQ